MNLVLIALIVRERGGVFSGFGVKTDRATASDDAKEVDRTRLGKAHLAGRSDGFWMDALYVSKPLATVGVVDLI